MDGSVGADFNSLSVMLYLGEDPTETLRMPLDDGEPALGVPQYWHRADGFDDMFIAHAESKHLVRFAREHEDAAQEPPGISVIASIKSVICVFISLCLFDYIKN